jgi:hypothetical protein
MNIEVDAHNGSVRSNVRFELMVPLSAFIDMSVRGFDSLEV